MDGPSSRLFILVPPAPYLTSHSSNQQPGPDSIDDDASTNSGSDYSEDALSYSQSSDSSYSPQNTLCYSHDDGIKVSPVVGSLSACFFHRAAVNAGLGLASKDDDRENLVPGPLPSAHFEGNPDSIILVECIGDHGDRRYYAQAHLEGERVGSTTISVGDMVMVKPNPEDQKAYYSKKQLSISSPNHFAHEYWFGKIISFHEPLGGERELDEIQMHLHWCEHASRTFIGECANSQELFLIDECADVHIMSFIQKVSCEWLDAAAPVFKGDEVKHSTSFFCTRIWDEQELAFLHLPSPTECSLLLGYLPSTQREVSPCLSCAQDRKNEYFCSPHLSNNGFKFHGDVFHLHDFIFLPPTDGDILLRKAQIKEIYTEGIRVQLYISLEGNESFLLPTAQLLEVRSTPDTRAFCKFIVEHCWTKPRSIEDPCTFSQEDFDWVAKGNFFVDPTVAICLPCDHKRKQEEAALLQFQSELGPGIMMDAFAGGGLFSYGLHLGGNFSTKLAIDQDEAASKTFQQNHPNAQVVTDDIGKLLDVMAIQTLGTNDGSLQNIPQIQTQDGVLSLEDLPQRGTFRLLAGGPPCQSFSRLNRQPHQQRLKDKRIQLPLSMISIAELYRPQQFLLENVQGLLSFHLEIEGVIIENGLVKLLVSLLLALGYQTRVTMLQAASYGAPQQRCRVFIMAAQRDEDLPNVPHPTHAFPGKMTISSVWDFPVYFPVRGCGKGCTWADEQYYDRLHWGPYQCVTVNDAISDLPKFDLINTHHTIPQTKKDKESTKMRINQGIAQLIGDRDQTSIVQNFPYGQVQYGTPASNLFQHKMRAESLRYVTHHCFNSLNTKTVELVTSIPLFPGACHKDAPKILWKGQKSLEKAGTKYLIRLHPNGVFGTTTTSHKMSRENMKTIHPDQKRVVTVRELARAQALPDAYCLTGSHGPDTPSTLKDMYRIIGNGVPIPLGYALGREYERAHLRTRQRRQKEEVRVYRREGSVEL